MTYSDFSNNSASSSSNTGLGGGILSLAAKGASAIIRFSTIYGNTSNAGGGIWIDPTSSSQMTIGGNIVAANSAHDGPDISGVIISDGYNLIENVAGATETLAVLPGSTAIDAVPQQACSITIADPSGQNVTITTDQRGAPRPDGSESTCDVGAYESSY